MLSQESANVSQSFLKKRKKRRKGNRIGRSEGWRIKGLEKEEEEEEEEEKVDGMKRRKEEHISLLWESFSTYCVRRGKCFLFSSRPRKEEGGGADAATGFARENEGLS